VIVAERPIRGDQRKTWFWFACIASLFLASVVVALMVSQRL
jgi:hypothetical protein